MFREMDELIKSVTDALAAVKNVSDLAALDQIRIDYLGRKGKVTQRLKQLGQLPEAERPAAGQAIR